MEIIFCLDFRFFHQKIITLSKEADDLCIIESNNKDGVGDCIVPRECFNI